MITANLKRCAKCKEWLEIESFSGATMCYCKPCMAKYNQRREPAGNWQERLRLSIINDIPQTILQKIDRAKFLVNKSRMHHAEQIINN